MESRFIQGEQAFPFERELLSYRLRAGIITEVFDDQTIRDTTSNDQNDASADIRQKYGKVKIQWLDGVGEAPDGEGTSVMSCFVDWMYGSGFYFMPNVGDIAVCMSRPGGNSTVVGFLNNKLGKQIVTGKINENDLKLATIRRLNAGEISVVSNEQGELYLDRNGNIRGIVRDTSKTENFDYSGQTLSRTKNSEVLAEFTLGRRVNTVIDPSTHKFTEVKESGKSIIFELKLSSGAGSITMNEDGKIVINSSDINLGDTSAVELVQAARLVSQINSRLAILDKHTHGFSGTGTVLAPTTGATPGSILTDINASDIQTTKTKGS